jgi:hypothetical protein
MSRSRECRRITPIVVRATLFLLVLAGALGLPGSVLGTSLARAADTFPVVNTLGAAGPTTTFSVFGAGGQPISGSHLAGPKFELSQPAVITEIGAFVNNCGTIVGDEPRCPGTRPFTVQIRASLNGVPDPSSVLATLVLSHDDDPLVVSYESVSPNLSLGAGTYFALFAAQGADAGFLAGFASSPFAYLAGSTTLGFLDPGTGTSFASEQFAAVRILGRAKTTDEQLVDLLAVVSGGNIRHARPLRALLIAAQKLLATGHVNAACRTLDAFVTVVHARSGKSLTSAQAERLTADALRIEQTIGC